MPLPAIQTRIGRRFAGVLLLVALAPLLVLALSGIAQSLQTARESGAERLGEVSEGFAERIVSRLTAAESIARALTQSDAGADGAHLRAAIEHVPAFTSVAVVAPGTPIPGVSLVSDAEHRLAVRAGQSFIVAISGSGERQSLYLVRAVRATNVESVAYFELSRDWLWGDGGLARRFARLVVDENGAELYGPADLSPALRGMFAGHGGRLAEPAHTQGVAWQSGGREWRGAVAHVELPPAFAAAPRWAVVAYASPREIAMLPARAWLTPLVLVALALLLVLAGTTYLSARYVKPLGAIEERLRRLGERDFSGTPLSAADEIADVTASLAAAQSALAEEFRALETIGEVDRLLLGSAALEQVIDAVLPRVQAVTRCDSVGIALIDANAPVHARVYATSRQTNELPVSRVTIDPDMLATLDLARQGLTVARCEEDRHSFLKPLRELGSEFFWVWPVRAGERLLAVLCIGFLEPPAPAPQLAGRGGEFAARLAIALSNTERDEQLYRQAHFDALTGLPNRLLFRDRLEQELASATAGLSRGGLLYVDLDHFKKVNDSVGHSAGDQLLTIVAQRLRSCVKEGDTVARLGGDEFTIILRNVSDPEAARAVADRVIESVQLPVNVAGRDHFVRASVGITLFPDDGVAIDELMRNADLAMYRAKESGRSRAVFFDRKMAAALAIAADSGLYRALRRREFSLFYQPQFDLRAGRLAGLEGLLRWQTPRDGMRQPLDFVPAAEESGLIVDIGAWVLDVACAQLAAWREQGIAPPRLALNISAQQLRYAEFPRNLKRVLEKYGLPPEFIELELTESVFADEFSARTLSRLAELGVRLALDDFGTGYSSLNYLRQFPIHTVKIDRSFLEDIPHNPSAATLAETIIVSAHAFGKTVVGEGVETVEQLDFLRERGCDFAQGFYLSRPLSTSAVTELLESRRIPADEESRVRVAG